MTPEEAAQRATEDVSGGEEEMEDDMGWDLDMVDDDMAAELLGCM